MQSDSLWTPVGRIVSADDDAASSAPEDTSCGDLIHPVNKTSYRSSGSGKPIDGTTLHLLGKASSRLSPLPVKGGVHSRDTSLEHVYNNDSLHGTSSTGLAVGTGRTSPTTLHSSISDMHTSPVPSNVCLPMGDAAHMSGSMQISTTLPSQEHHIRHIGVGRARGGAVMAQSGCAFTQGTRRSMEDRHQVEERDGYSFFGVYDGHGGAQCAEYLHNNLHNFFFEQLDSGKDAETALLESIIHADKEFVFSQSQTWGSEPAGSCCAVAVLTDDRIIVGNVGDSEIVRCRDGDTEVLSVRHTPRENTEEKCRVERAGGRIVGSRVRHPTPGAAVASIALSRSIGDAGFKLHMYTEGKDSGVIGDPYVRSFKRTKQDGFLVIACDGLWDVVPHETVVKQCRDMIAKGQGEGCGKLPPTATELADALVNLALEEGSSDNITVVVVLTSLP